MIRSAENARIRVDWLDRLIGEIHREREHNDRVQKTNILRVQVKKIKKQLT